MSQEDQELRPIVIRATPGGFGGASLVFCILGALVCIGGGLSLVGLKAAGDNSMIQALANGIGWYCLGKGIFMLAVPFQVRGAVLKILGR